jgi:hypothetical protein
MNYVQITFDCLPLRSIPRMDIPIDASPKFRERCERIKRAIETHGSHNTYFLYNARCAYHLCNSEELGTLHFRFEGTAMTDAADQRTQRCALEVELEGETCDWLRQPIVEWFRETVERAVAVEFDRYIAAGDLARTVERAARLQAEADQHGGYVGMGL